MKRINSQIRGPMLFGHRAALRFRNAEAGQPITLLREPMNPVDSNAVICLRADGQPMGYVARDAAAIVGPEMDKGYMWRAKVRARAASRRSVYITLWREEPGSMEEIMGMQTKPVEDDLDSSYEIGG